LKHPRADEKEAKRWGTEEKEMGEIENGKSWRKGRRDEGERERKRDRWGEIGQEIERGRDTEDKRKMRKEKRRAREK